MRIQQDRTVAPLRSQGNLSFIQFLQLLQKMWIDAHPDIPLVAQGGKEFSSYPVMTYRLDQRQAMQGEPKPKIREEIVTAPGESNLLIFGQRFHSVVTFTVYTNENPYLAEEIIEVFENFMMEFTWVFKALGLSEILYSRRLPDSDGQRGKGLGIVEKSVSYMITTEKVIVTERQKLEQVLIDARVFVEDPYWAPDATPATPIIIEINDQFTGLATPNS